MKNKFKKGDIIFIVDDDGNDTNSSMWVDRNIEVEDGDIFEIGTTKHAPLIKMQCMSNQVFPLIARIIEDKM